MAASGEGIKQIIAKYGILEMRNQIIKSLKNLNLDIIAKELWRLKNIILFSFKRRFGWVDQEIIKNYFNEEKVQKLHIGCGNNILEGWLNSDYYPGSKTIVHLDATKVFPFADKQLNYIFSEHMIEHITYSQGLFMLSECFRILRENGKIRISTPDLAFLIDLYKEEKTEIQKDYIQWATENIIPKVPYFYDTFVINNFVREWGHLFIYDEKTLRLSLEKAGFCNIVRHDLNQSADKILQGLENESRMPIGFLNLETITLEGTKLIKGL